MSEGRRAPVRGGGAVLVIVRPSIPPTANAPLVMHDACAITQEIFLTGRHELDISSG